MLDAEEKEKEAEVEVEVDGLFEEPRMLSRICEDTISRHSVSRGERRSVNRGEKYLAKLRIFATHICNIGSLSILNQRRLLPPELLLFEVLDAILFGSESLVVSVSVLDRQVCLVDVLELQEKRRVRSVHLSWNQTASYRAEK